MDLNDTNSTDNNNYNIQQDKPKRTRNRLTKKQQYSKEREELIQQLNNIIGIDDKKNYVYLYDLEHNEEILKSIKEKVPDIKKYHKCGAWGYFLDKERGGGNVIGLIRTLYKDNDIIITTKNKIIERDDKKLNSTVYYFNKIVK